MKDERGKWKKIEIEEEIRRENQGINRDDSRKNYELGKTKGREAR